MEVPNQPKILTFQRDILAQTQLNTGHAPRNGSKVTCGFTMKG